LGIPRKAKHMSFVPEWMTAMSVGQTCVCPTLYANGGNGANYTNATDHRYP